MEILIKIIINLTIITTIKIMINGHIMYKQRNFQRQLVSRLEIKNLQIIKKMKLLLYSTRELQIILSTKKDIAENF